MGKSQLVTVALTCRSYQPEAERLLYESVTLDDSSTADRACLKTLATSPRRAILVRSFHLECRVELDVETAHLQTLGDALLEMKSLRFLYLQIWRHQAASVQLVLNTVLRCGWNLKLSVECMQAESSFF
jgi:hypothetical protein